MKKLNLSRAYVKYMIKTPLVFYAFLVFSITAFLLMSSAVQLDDVVGYEGEVHDNYVFLNGKVPSSVKIAYMKLDGDERIKMEIEEIVESENGVYIFFDDNSDLANMKDGLVEVVVGKKSLLKVMYQKLGSGE